MKRIATVVGAILFVTLLAVLAFSVNAAVIDHQGDAPGDVELLPKVEEEGPAPAGNKGLNQTVRGLSHREGPVQVMIELEAEPTALIYAASLQANGPENIDAAAATQAQLARIESAQEALLPALAEVDATVLYRVQRVYNGIAAVVDAEQLEALAVLPGVKAIHPLTPHERHHATSVGLIGAPELWNGAGSGLTGEGISIGIIDTGIDYIHTDFGGPGTAEAYIANDTEIVGDVPYFPSPKVVGGYDFAGDDYDAGGDASSSIPNPDPDPMDCNGHGSHVAGTAAGYGVLPNGSTYNGPWTEELDLLGFRIAPGVAPEADLYALRVFGCDGSTNLTTAAIEWAMDPNGDGDLSDHLDVINMSLGSGFGSDVDASTVAANNAAAAGVIVVASAGNSADAFYITGAPGIGDRVISVAGVVDASSVMDGFRVESGALADEVFPASKGSAFDWTDFDSLTAPLTYPADQSSGCDAFSPENQALISGTIVLLDWTEGECGSGARGNNLEDAGAIGMLLADNSEIFDLSIFGSDEMPSYSIPNYVGAELKAALTNEGNVTVTFSEEYDNSILLQEPQFVDVQYGSTSRGPKRSNLLKPDVAAPAVSVFSAAVGTGDEGASFNGTSMAAPHVSGSMALLRQQHPGWSVEELKALLMNTALHNVRKEGPLDSPQLGPARVGAGRINLPNASNSDVVVYSQGKPGAVTANFGELEVVDEMTVVRSVRVVNKGAETVSFELSYEPMTDMPGVEYSISPSSITLAPFGVEEVEITMTADASEMQHTPDPSIDVQVNGLWRHWISDEGGYLRLMPPVTTFMADLSGANEVPPVATDGFGMAVFTYTASTGELEYMLDASDLSSDATAAHIHLGLPGVNGGVVIPLYNGVDPLPVTGSTVITESQLIHMLSGHYYVNVHTQNNPPGEIRGQIRLSEGQPPLRLPLYTVARPASQMEAVQDSFVITQTEAISLTGQGVNTGNNFPYDYLSWVSAYELQYESPDEPLSFDGANGADLAYIGVNSDIRATETVTDPMGVITDTTIYFGIATHGDWTTPTAFDSEFDIYIDVDQDGVTDYILLNLDLASAGYPYSQDTFFSFLIDLSTGEWIPQYYLNGISAMYNTYIFNTNVINLPLAATDIGLTMDDASFNYRVVSFSRDLGGTVDGTPWLTYDAANPGIHFIDGPLYPDLDGEVIPIEGDRANYLANGSMGILLFHHYNTSGNRVEILEPGIDVVAEADLMLEKTANVETATAGDILTYTLTVTNMGEIAADVVVTDTLPMSVTFQLASDNCNVSNNTVTCQLGALGMDETESVWIRVTADSAGTITNMAEVGSSATDIDESNNTAQVTVTVGDVDPYPYKVYLPIILHEAGADGE